MTKAPDANMLQQEAISFRDGFSTVLMSTSSPTGEPDISYAPYVEITGRIAVFISELAAHTRNLFDNPRASLMFIANEQDSRNLFARRRLILQALAEPVGRDSDLWIESMQQLQTRHGNTIELLQSLPDFHLFHFRVKGGTWVRGFGQAFTVINDALEIDPNRRSR